MASSRQISNCSNLDQLVKLFLADASNPTNATSRGISFRGACEVVVSRLQDLAGLFGFAIDYDPDRYTSLHYAVCANDFVAYRASSKTPATNRIDRFTSMWNALDTSDKRRSGDYCTKTDELVRGAGSRVGTLSISGIAPNIELPAEVLRDMPTTARKLRNVRMTVSYKGHTVEVPVSNVSFSG